MKSTTLKRLSVRLGRSKSSKGAAETHPGSILFDHTPPVQDALPKIEALSPIPDQRQVRPERALSGLLGLPSEILLGVAEFLDDATVICLSSTSHRFFQLLRSLTSTIKERDRSRCAKWLIMAQLEGGIAIDARRSNANIKLTCVLCKIKLATTSFERYQPPTTNPNVMESGFEHLHMLSRGSFARFCEHHAMRTVLGRESSDPRRNADQTIRWECCYRRMCLHCGTVPNDASPPTCGCVCTVCPKDAQVPTFVRYGLARAGEKAIDDLRVFFLRFERGAAGAGGPLLAVERVHKRDDKKWIEAPITRIPVEFR